MQWHNEIQLCFAATGSAAQSANRSMRKNPEDTIRKKPIFGLRTIEMGDWTAGDDFRDGNFVANKSTGFRVFIRYPHPRLSTPTRYIVESSDGFRMGFTFSTSSPAIHEPADSGIPGTIYIGSIGGEYKGESVIGNEGFPVLSDTTHFRSRKEQELFLSALRDAVPRIPVLGHYAFLQDGGFGYTVEFTDELQKALDAGEYIASR